MTFKRQGNALSVQLKQSKNQCLSGFSILKSTDFKSAEPRPTKADKGSGRPEPYKN